MSSNKRILVAPLDWGLGHISRCIPLIEKLFLSYQSDIVKSIYIFDYFYNEKVQEVKIGFRIVFQSKETTLTAKEIELIYNKLINQSLKIDGISIPGI